MTHFSRRSLRTRRGQAGIALIEAMVGMMIFAFGVLGVVGLQASMTKAQTASKYRADASNLANELLGRMWGDASANLPQYATSSCGSYANCKDWLSKLQNTLPQGAATVTVTLVSPAGTPAIYEANVEVTWSQPGEQGGHRHVVLARVEP